MPLRPFDYQRPRSLPELFEILEAGKTGSFALIGGGTDILVKIRQRLLSPSTVISLGGLQELTKLEQDGGDVFIGAGVTLSGLENSALILSHFPALARAAGSVGSPQLRNMGTVGGNICLDSRCLYFNQPAWPGAFAPCYKRGGDGCHVIKGGKRCYAIFCSDTPAALLAYDARIRIAGAGGEREVPADEFYRDDSLHCLSLGEKELVTGLKIPVKSSVGAYVRFSARGAIDFPLVGAAVVMEKDATGNDLNFRIAATGVLSRPVRLRKVEEILAGGIWPRKLTDKELSEGLSGIRPTPHHGVSPSYRREILKVLVERALESLMGEFNINAT